MHLPSTRSSRGMAVAPHALAAQSAAGVLREGGNAVEAMIAAAATIAVVYPHMNSIGGDGFWLIARPGEAPRGIEGCGAAAARSHASTRYREARPRGDSVPRAAWRPTRSPARCRAGTPRCTCSREALGGRLPLSRLLDDAIDYARDGITGHAQPGALRRRQARRARRRSRALPRRFLQPAARCRGRRALRAAAPGRDAGATRPRAASTTSTAASCARSIAADLAARRQPADARRPASSTARGWKTPLALTHSLRHDLQHAAAHAGAGVAADSRHARPPARCARHGPARRRLRACVRRGDQAGLPVRDRVHHRSGLHGRSIRRRCSTPRRSTRWPPRVDAERAAPWGQRPAARPTRSGWARSTATAWR